MFFGCERDHQLSAYLTGGVIGGYPKCVKLRIGGGSITMYTYALTLYRFMFLSAFLFYSVLFYL